MPFAQRVAKPTGERSSPARLIVGFALPETNCPARAGVLPGRLIASVGGS
ncbi:MAG: hypothetical protein KJZ70_09205 [Bryobacterales bacterium]|nr:hypothetical protein [Bryobacterales bacterium]